MRELTPKQEAFVREYLIDLNATQAAIRAKYSAKTAEWIGPQLLGKTHVAAAIQAEMNKRSEKTSITSEYVITTVRDTIERCRQAKPVLNRTGEPVMVETPDGEVVPAYAFDASNVLKGCELLGRHLVLWKDVGSKDNPLTMDSLSDEELDARLSALEAKGK